MSTRAEREAKESLNRQHQAILNALLERPENSICADCKSKDPRWVSWNLGVFVCIDCSGVHRSVGTHISRVKSVNLDTWTNEQIESMQRWGNARANAFWEAFMPPSTKAQAMGLNAFIRAKYERREWAPKGPIPTPPLEQDDDSAASSAVEAAAGAKKKKEKKHKKAASESMVTSTVATGDQPLPTNASRITPIVPKPAPAVKSQVGILLADLDSPSTSSDALVPDMSAPANLQAPATHVSRSSAAQGTSLTASHNNPSRSTSVPNMAIRAPQRPATATPDAKDLQALEDIFHGLNVVQTGTTGISSPPPTASTPSPPAALSSAEPDLLDLAPSTNAQRKAAVSKESIMSLYAATGQSAATHARVGTPPVFASGNTIYPSFRPSLGRVDTPPVFASPSAIPAGFPQPGRPSAIPGVNP